MGFEMVSITRTSSTRLTGTSQFQNLCRGARPVPGYPYVPILFIVVATWFVFNTLVEQTADSVVGLLLLVAGIPFYIYWERAMKKAATKES